MLIKAIRKLLKLKSASGIFLLSATLIALAISNSSLFTLYHQWFETTLGIKLGNISFQKNLSFWINDVLMVFFFLMVCLEIKWEMVKGELKDPSKRMLPFFAALGGMGFPACFYLLINWNNPEAHHGWAIPTATDIAFSLGILSLLGNRVPLALKVFLSAIAIFDDLGAIVIIAIFYTTDLSLLALSISIVIVLILTIMNRLNVMRNAPYLIGGCLLWVCLLNSGVHPTLAGVVTGFAIPIHSRNQDKSIIESTSVLSLSSRLHPWVNFLILPLFAFANAGINFTSNLTFDHFLNPITIGIALGLFIGKQVGIFSGTFLAVKLKLCALPRDMTWSTVYGISFLCGIGFTMSLFIGALAFQQEAYIAVVRLGVLLGSLISGTLGFCFLYINMKTPKPHK